jgi:hypothetical protein
MTTQLKTQLSLVLLAAVAGTGLLGMMIHSVHKDFTLYHKVDAEQIADASGVVPNAAPAETGAVLGATDLAANPLQGIYVNPFAAAVGKDPAAVPTVAVNQAGSANVNSSSQPTAPIQMYGRGYVYPIVELNNCTSGQACFNYCDQAANVPLCAVFAQRQGFMNPTMVVAVMKLFPSAGQLTSRVLGASDSASSFNDVSLANPYAKLNQNFSNPALNNYLAANASSGCAPLDMICLSKLSSPADPRVLARSIEQIDSGNGPELSEGDGTSVEDAPTTVANANNCVTNASGGIANIDPVLILPEDAAAAQENISNCQQNAGQTIADGAETKKQESISDILEFQDCVANSKNLAVDIKKCINQGLR